MTRDEFIRRLEKTLAQIQISQEDTAELVAEVRSYLDETGEEPLDAFGDPESYAFARTGASPESYRPSLLARIGALYLWSIAITTAFTALFGNRSAAVAMWNLVLTAALAGGAFVLWRRNRPVASSTPSARWAEVNTVQRLALLAACAALVAGLAYTLLPFDSGGEDCGYAWAAVSTSGDCAAAAEDRVRTAVVGSAAVVGVAFGAMVIFSRPARPRPRHRV